MIHFWDFTKTRKKAKQGLLNLAGTRRKTIATVERGNLKHSRSWGSLTTVPQPEAGGSELKRKISKKKFAKKCRELSMVIRDMRTWKLKDIFKRMNQILVGYYHYYGITDNGRSLYNMLYRAEKLLFYWLNRRSEKKSYTWDAFHDD